MVGEAGTIGNNRATGELLDALISLADLVKDDKALKNLKKATADNLASAERAGVGTSLKEARNNAKKILEDAKAKKADADAYYATKRAEADDLAKVLDKRDREAQAAAKETAKLLKARENAVQGREDDLKKALKDLETRTRKLSEDAAVLETRRREVEAWADRIRKATAV